MSQFVDEAEEGAEGQVQDTKISLQTHLSRYNVPNGVYKLLCDESITIDELVTFTNEDLKDWCNEHSLKTIERRRFLNAVKSLPNATANKKLDNEPKIIPVLIGNEEKEQLSQFDEMKKNVENMINQMWIKQFKKLMVFVIKFKHLLKHLEQSC